uniref:Uncharacterized protein n=1 Tax=Rhizophora mucronata TaxID=61149 RepID=A0A2P2NPD6_RHIMU
MKQHLGQQNPVDSVFHVLMTRLVFIFISI